MTITARDVGSRNGLGDLALVLPQRRRCTCLNFREASRASQVRQQNNLDPSSSKWDDPFATPGSEQARRDPNCPKCSALLPRLLMRLKVTNEALDDQHGRSDC